MTKKYSVLSLFSGCGGLDLGFRGDFSFLGKNYEKHNYDLLFANDIDKNACNTFLKNFNHSIVCEDVRNFIGDSQNSSLEKILPKNIDIVLGGFPCQDFSNAGKRKGFDSERGTLYQSMVEVVKYTKPNLFLAENVKGLLSIDNGKAIETIVSDFRKLGYNVKYNLFMTADFGVPQKRERVVIVGTKEGVLPEFEFPTPILSSDNWITLEKAISDLENLDEGEVDNHYWSKARKNKGQGNSVLKKHEPGPTMRAEHHGNIEFHWNEKRRLSAREAARIQSFPDNFVFLPSTSSAYKQIGNAVPPVFAWHLASSVKKFLNYNLA